MEKYRNSSATLNTTYPLTNRFLNTGPLYTMCASSNNSPRQGPQLLMNTTSVGTSTQFQFVPARQSSTHFSGPFQFDMGSIAPIFNSVKTFFSNLIRPKVDAQTLSAYDTTEKRMCNSAPNIDSKCIGEFDKSCFVDVTDSGMLEKISLSTKSFSEYNLPNSVVKSNSCISPKVPENIQKVDIISSLKEAKSPHTTKETETETEKQEASVPPVVVKAPPSPVPILQPKLRSNCSVMPNVPTRPRTQRSDGKRKSRKKSTKSGKNKKEKNRHELAQNIHEDVETETETVSADEWEDPLVIISAVKITSIEPSEKITSKVVCFSNDDFPAILPDCSSSSNAKNNSANKQTWELPRLSHCFSTLNGKKQRQISECDSEDSFIVFDNSDKLTPSSVDSNQSICDRIRSTLSVRRQRQLSESSDDDFICFELENSDADCDTDDDHDDDDDDDCDGQPTSYSDCESEVDVKSCGTNPPDSGFEEKKVRFNLKPVVHVLRTWTFAYHQARKGEWEQNGRDRVRFHDRIKRLEPTLLPILDSDHRQKIYCDRFREYEVDDKSAATTVQ